MGKTAQKFADVKLWSRAHERTYSSISLTQHLFLLLNSGKDRWHIRSETLTVKLGIALERR